MILLALLVGARTDCRKTSGRSCKRVLPCGIPHTRTPAHGPARVRFAWNANRNAPAPGAGTSRRFNPSASEMRRPDPYNSAITAASRAQIQGSRDSPARSSASVKRLAAAIWIGFGKLLPTLGARIADSAAEAEASQRADTAKTAIMHAISHDLRTPLTAITTAAGALKESELGPEDRHELASVVATEADRLAHMVGDLLDLSRIEAGAVNPQTDWCDLNETVARSAEQVRSERGEHTVRFDMPGDLPLVRADATQLERVFTNLIDNAIKFSPADEPVEVRGACANGRVTIRVIDRGRGIPPAQQSHVFEPFIRGDSQPGSGLGLAICRGFVEANGGRITLQSRTRDGSAFAVTFPIAPQPAIVG